MGYLSNFRQHFALTAAFGRPKKNPPVEVAVPATRGRKRKVEQDYVPQTQQTVTSEIPSLFSALSESLDHEAPPIQMKNKHEMAKKKSTSLGRTSVNHQEQHQQPENSEESEEYARTSKEYSTLVWKQTLDPNASDTWIKLLDNEKHLKLPQFLSLVEILELVLTDKQLKELTPPKIVSLMCKKLIYCLKKPNIKDRVVDLPGLTKSHLPAISIGRVVYLVEKACVPISTEAMSTLIKSMLEAECTDIHTAYVLSKHNASKDLDWNALKVGSFGDMLVLLLMCRRILSQYVRNRHLMRGERKQKADLEVQNMNKALRKIFGEFSNPGAHSSSGNRSLSLTQSIQISDLLLSIIMGIMNFKLPAQDLEWIQTCRFLDADKLSPKLILRVYSSAVSLTTSEDNQTELDEEELEKHESLLSHTVIGQNQQRHEQYTAKLVKKGTDGNWDFEERLELLALAANSEVKQIELAFKVPSVVEILNSINADLQRVHLRIDQLHKIVNTCWKVLALTRTDILRYIETLYQNSDNKFLFERTRLTPKHAERKEELVISMDASFRSLGRSLSRLVGEGDVNIATAFKIMFLLLIPKDTNTRAINQMQFAFASSISKGDFSLKDKRRLKVVNKYYYASHTGSRKLKDIINMVLDGQDQYSLNKAVENFLKTKSAMLKSSENPK